jgi:hypothetical protein
MDMFQGEEGCWQLKGEGNANAVFAYVGKKPELVCDFACCDNVQQGW